MDESSHNLGEARRISRRWAGVLMHSIDLCARPGRAWHCIDSTLPLLSIVVSEAGGHCEARRQIGSRAPTMENKVVAGRGHISLIPAGYRVWGYSENISRVIEARIELAPDQLEAAMGDDYDGAITKRPRLMFQDEKVQQLSQMLISAGADPAYPDLFGDHVMLAVMARLSGLEGAIHDRIGGAGLPPRQLALVQEFIRENIATSVRLADLAALVSLSQSQFGRAFKAATGVSPHKWQMNTRIERAKALLLDQRTPLAEIALMAGYSEQSHFTRAFHASTGAPPGAWRESRLA